jgi:hypothetical protein
MFAQVVKEFLWVYGNETSIARSEGFILFPDTKLNLFIDRSIDTDFLWLSSICRLISSLTVGTFFKIIYVVIV